MKQDTFLNISNAIAGFLFGWIGWFWQWPEQEETARETMDQIIKDAGL